MIRLPAFIFLFLLSCSTKTKVLNIENSTDTVDTPKQKKVTTNLAADTLVSNQNEYVVKAIKTETGWGYQVFKGAKLMINQPTIPAIQGNRSFKSKLEASRVGEFVLSKIKQNQFPPTISTEELKSLGIN